MARLRLWAATIIKGNRELYLRRCVTRQEWMSVARGTKNVVFLIVFGTVMFELTFGR